MNDDWMCLAMVCTGLVVAYFTVRFCADAVLHSGRDWWKKAIFLAEQRVAYREFVKGLDESAELAKMMRNEE